MGGGQPLGLEHHPSRRPPGRAGPPHPPTQRHRSGVAASPGATAEDRPASPATPRLPGPIHVVARGETWWGLAEGLWGDGERFAELKAHNLGRAQPDETVVGPDSVLRAGWTIEVPLSKAGP